MLKKLFTEYVRELEFLKGSSPNTIELYERSFKRYSDHCEDVLPTKPILNQFVVAMRERGLSTVTCNITIRSINSFLSWLAENEYCPKLRIKQLKEEKRAPHDVPIESLKRLIHYQPKSRAMKRCWAMCMTLIDSGCRIGEVISLQRSKVDLENCLMWVIGKGNKERIIPISLELRKVLYKHLKSHKHDYVFCTQNGFPLSYDNARRDFGVLCDNAKVPHIPFHDLRHNFAINFIRNGGDVFSLKRFMGHASLQTTMIYVNSNTEDLKLVHKKTNVLSKIP